MGSGKKHSNRKPIVIGVSLPTLREMRWVRDKEGMEAAANDRGAVLKIEYYEFDASKQVSQVEKLISQGIDVLIIAPGYMAGYPTLIEKAHKAGVKVVDYEALLRNADLELYIAINRRRIGQLQGLYLITHVPKGNYIIMSGDPGVEYKEGAMEYIQPRVNTGDIKIVTDKAIKGWDPNIAYNTVKDSLIANKNNVNAVLAPNDAIAGASIQALQEQGLAGKVAVTGQDADLDAIKRIMQGTQSMTVLKNTRELGKRAVEAAVNLVQGKPVDTTTTLYNGKMDVPAILLEPVLTDKSNIDSVIIGSGFYTKEQVYGRKK